MTNEKETTRELLELGSQLAHMPNRTPYRVPAGYFESLAHLILLRIHTESFESAAEELANLSPLLAGLEKKMPYSVPDNYFTQVPVIPKEKAHGRVVSMPARKVFRYAAAAVAAGLIMFSAWFYLGNVNEPKSELAAVSDTLNELNKLENISEGEMAAFMEAGAMMYLPEQNPAPGELAGNDVQWLLSDVSDHELEQYLKQHNPTVEKFN